MEAQQAHLSTELGRAQGSRIRELLRSFSGQTIDGVLFGLEGLVVLPSFSPPGTVMAYRSPDGHSGFTPAARAYAAAHGVPLSTRSDLDQIARILGQY